MRILLINDYGHPSGGAENIVLNLRLELERRGHEVRLFTSDAMLGREHHAVDYRCRGTVGSLRTLLQCANLSAAASLRRALAGFRPDVVHVNLYLTQLSPFILPVLRNVPTVYYAQWYRAICPLGTKRLPDLKPCFQPAGHACLRNGCLPLHDWIPLQLQRLIDGRWRGAFMKITAISQSVADQLAKFGGSAFQNVEVIHPGVRDAVCRTEFSENPLFLFAGRLVPEKGADVLLRAFSVVLSKIPRAGLVVIGDGPERGRLSCLASELRISERVDFRGAMDNSTTLRAMREAWAVCVPSVWEEPFGLVALESQMNGVPVIASRCGGLAEIVTENSGGILVAPRDEEALAAAMVSICADRSALHNLGRASHRNAMRSFRLSNFAERFEGIYSSIV